MAITTAGIDAAALRAMLESGQPVTVLDVRKTEDRAEWAIPGSLHVDAYDALKAGDPNALAGIDLPTDALVVTVCGAGKVSLTAADQLRERGFDAVSLAGGMKAWSLAWNSAEVPLPVSDTAVVQVRRTGKGCLSYLVGSEGKAAVINPALDPEIYLDLARRYGWVITHVLETHIHADHLMRSRSLAALTGATLRIPATDRLAFPAAPLRDGDVLDVGNGALRVLATPGHTLESATYLLDGEAVFTGDTLFLEGVGRPDLEASPEQARERAHLIYHSLRKLLALAPQTIVLPGHTNRPVAFNREPLRATLHEIRGRVGMLKLDETDFVETILTRIPPTPPNHAAIVAFNEAGEWPADDPTDLEAGANRCAVS
jgi:glyoxylase-like metal-dependent hydrolase (beta-lactamase superfamily II)